MTWRIRGASRRRPSRVVDRLSWATALALVPESGDVEEFVAAVGKHRDRDIRIIGCDLPPDAPSGMWIELPDYDCVVCVHSASSHHRRVVICHEMAHMLLGHKPVVGVLDISVIAPSISGDVAARFFHRQGYADNVEADAEALATALAAELVDRLASTAAQDNISARLR